MAVSKAKAGIDAQLLPVLCALLLTSCTNHLPYPHRHAWTRQSQSVGFMQVHRHAECCMCRASAGGPPAALGPTARPPPWAPCYTWQARLGWTLPPCSSTQLTCHISSSGMTGHAAGKTAGVSWLTHAFSTCLVLQCTGAVVLVGLTGGCTRQAALDRQDLSCTYLA